MSWRKLKLLLMRKRQLVEYTLMLEDVINYKIDEIAKRIRELDPDKIYFIKADTEEQAENLKAVLNIIKRRAKHPLPKIIVSTEDAKANDKVF